LRPSISAWNDKKLPGEKSNPIDPPDHGSVYLVLHAVIIAADIEVLGPIDCH
jgi:hypothetical protein